MEPGDLGTPFCGPTAACKLAPVNRLGDLERAVMDVLWQASAGQAISGQPGTGQPGTRQPGTGQAGTGQAGTGQPGTRQPGTGQPGTRQPGTGQPGAGRPDAGLTVRQVSGRLADRELAHTTVMTVLDRLAKKGFARRERDGRAWRYRPTASREAYVAELMLSALAQTGDRSAALARFARSVSDDEARVLRRALAALERGDPR